MRITSRLRADSVRDVCLVVLLRLNFATRQTPHTLRLNATVCEDK